MSAPLHLERTRRGRQPLAEHLEVCGAQRRSGEETRTANNLFLGVGDLGSGEKDCPPSKNDKDCPPSKNP